MATEYRVKLKFEKDFSGTSGGAAGGSSGGGTVAAEQKKQTKTAEKSSGSLLKIAGSLFSIGLVLKSIQSFIEPIMEAIQYLAYMGIAKIVEWIQKNFEGAKKLGESIVEGGKKIIQGDVVGAISEYASGMSESLKSTPVIGEYFKLLESSLKTTVEFLANAGVWLWENVIVPGWNVLLGVGQWIWDNVIKPSFEFLLNVGQWIWEQIIKPAFNFLADVGRWIWEQILKPSWDWVSNSIKSVWTDILQPAFKAVADAINGAISWISNSAVGKAVEGGVSLAKSAIGWVTGSRAFGGVIPEDGLYKMHAGETVSRGNTTNGGGSFSPQITVNIGSGGRRDQEFATEIAQQMMKELNRVQRF